MYPWLAKNSRCKPDWPQSQICLPLLPQRSAGSKGVHRHTCTLLSMLSCEHIHCWFSRLSQVYPVLVPWLPFKSFNALRASSSHSSCSSSKSFRLFLILTFLCVIHILPGSGESVFFLELYSVMDLTRKKRYSHDKAFLFIREHHHLGP